SCPLTATMTAIRGLEASVTGRPNPTVKSQMRATESAWVASQRSRNDSMQAPERRKAARGHSYAPAASLSPIVTLGAANENLLQSRQRPGENRMVGIARLVAPLLALALTGVATLSSAAAQEWPQRSVRFIIPFGAGAGADIGARLFAERLSTRWG